MRLIARPLSLHCQSLAALFTLALLAGCQQSAPTAGSTVPTLPAAARIEPATAKDGGEATDGKVQEETWDAYSMQGIRVGYSQTVTSRVQEGDKELVRTKSLIHTSMQRGGQTVTQEMTLTSWDTTDGQLVRFESRMAAGPGEIASVGVVRDGLLRIETTTLGRTEAQSIPWKADWGGLFAPEQSLRRQPLKPGQTRVIRSLLPAMNIPADTRLEALDYENAELPTPTRRVSEGEASTRSASEGTARHLKIKATVDMGVQKIESFLWTDDRGDTLKTLVPSLQQESIRTTKEDALRQADGKAYDLLAASTAPLKGSLPNAQHTKRVVYKAHVTSGSIAGLFSECASQIVKPIDDKTAAITVLAIRPDQKPSDAKAISQPTDADLASNNFIQSDDKLIADMAAQAAAREADVWKTACALEKFVDKTVRNKNFSSAFATAAEVARSLEGDCTEHAVLLAALCRARKIPARVAFGLVYYPPAKGFAYHMWNEVWIKDRWIPLDGTLGLGGIGSDHIKLGDSNLSGGSPLADLLAVVQVFGRLELEVIEAK